jgi:hypothetical protein
MPKSPETKVYTRVRLLLLMLQSMQRFYRPLGEVNHGDAD